MPTQGHEVQFYERDADVVEAVARYVLDGLWSGGRVLVVATPAHRALLDKALTERGVQLEHVRSDGSLVTLDAAETMRGFMVGGSPDPDLFDAQIGGLLDTMHGTGCQIWVYGEMVALLCAEGNVAGAVELESRWNDLGRSRQFSLLCGYPTSVLGSAALEQLRCVCESHSRVLAPMSYHSGSSPASPVVGTSCSQVFVPAPEAIAAGRRFIASVLRGWGEVRMVDDAVLVASELATNAMDHAGSPFRMTVDRSGACINLTVEDAAWRTPQVRKFSMESTTGRGMAIVQALTTRWGCDLLPSGKIVWADLPSSAPGS